MSWWIWILIVAGGGGVTFILIKKYVVPLLQDLRALGNALGGAILGSSWDRYKGRRR